MTQKELSYYEDAVGHEDNIIKIITKSIEFLKDSEVISFMEKEKEKHTEMRKRLMKLLEGECND